MDNPQRIIPAGLNAAIRASDGEVIVRMDAHSIPNPDYVALCVDALERGVAQNVGGVWNIQPGNDRWIARSIAAAAGNPLAVGDARYRYTDKAAYVDTVPYGSYKRELFDQIGLFDETLLANEDYELNTRIIQNGGKIWLDPKIRCAYFARATLGALLKQYFGYGYWKFQMLKRYPETLRWRQALRSRTRNMQTLTRERPKECAFSWVDSPSFLARKKSQSPAPDRAACKTESTI